MLDFSMVAINIVVVLFLLNIFYANCLRRIKDGVPVSSDKKYVVYLVKAPLSDKIYDSWVCGGALVTNLFIITSAACVNDVEYMYAIAGYRKYVPDKDIENDQCTKKKKKKVIYTCIPMKYELEYDKLEKWSFIDIALVKVESAYDFNDQSYTTVCSYIPATIPINYDSKYQVPGTDGFVLGWGHADVWRLPGDTKNYNQEMLQYAPVRIMEKEACKQHYAAFPSMSKVIDQYMICTLEKGELDENGQIVSDNPSPPKLNGCGGQRFMSIDDVPEDMTHRYVLGSNQISNDSLIEKNRTLVNQTSITRKSGICQNDHGGPFVTWVGAHEVLIGVASVFKVSVDSKCMGPYLYTSTVCNGAFLDCILNTDSKKNIRLNHTNSMHSRQAICDSPPILRGYNTVERHISWKNHPAGAAENEVFLNVRHQTDIHNIHKNMNTASEEFINFEKSVRNKTIAIRPQRPLNE